MSARATCRWNPITRQRFTKVRVRRHHRITVISVPWGSDGARAARGRAPRSPRGPEPCGAVLQEAGELSGDNWPSSSNAAPGRATHHSKAVDRDHRHRPLLAGPGSSGGSRCQHRVVAARPLRHLKRSARAHAYGHAHQERQVRVWRSRSIPPPDRLMVAGPRPTISMVSPGLHRLIASVSRLSSRRSCTNAAMPRPAGIHSSITR
jgi:hypothetical protein